MGKIDYGTSIGDHEGADPEASVNAKDTGDDRTRLETGEITPINRNQGMVSEVYFPNTLARCEVEVGKSRTDKDVAVGENDIMNGRNATDPVRSAGNVGSDTERSTKKPKAALELDVTGKTQDRNLDGNRKALTHRGGATAAEFDDVWLECPSGPEHELSLESPTVERDIGMVVATDLKPQFPKSTTGQINGQRIRPNSILHSDVPGCEPRMARDLDGTGRASLQDDRHPTDGVCGTNLQLDVAGREPGPESVMVEVNIGNTAASGPEHLLSPAEIPEQERKRRRPRGGKRSNLTGGQRRTYRKVREAEPE